MSASPPMAMPPMAMPPMAMPPMAMPPMGGMMPMSFYARYQNVTLLFASWMPTSKAGFVLSCIAICAAASCEVMLRKIAVRVERRLMRSRQPVLRRNAQRAVLTFFSSTLSYAIMLLAMTFDVYIFFSIMVGFALGTLIAGHWNDEPAMAKYEAHHSELQLSVTGMVCEACCRAVESALLAVPGVESAVVDLQSGSAMVVSAAVPVATLLAAVEATGKACRVAGERRSITSIARSPHPARGDAEFLLLASASDCCGR